MLKNWYNNEPRRKFICLNFAKLYVSTDDVRIVAIGKNPRTEQRNAADGMSAVSGQD